MKTAKQIKANQDNFDGIVSKEIARRFGYLTEVEIDAIIRFARICEPEPLFVNVGAGSGTSGLALREARDDATIYTVDFSSGGPLGGLQNEVNVFEEYGMIPTVQILGDSRMIAKTWQYGQIDLLLIDDGHEEDEIAGDIVEWQRWLAPGAYVLVHDYGSPNWPSVKEMCDILMPQYGIAYMATFDTLAVFRKA